jgi:hypothetical protein
MIVFGGGDHGGSAACAPDEEMGSSGEEIYGVTMVTIGFRRLEWSDGRTNLGNSRADKWDRVHRSSAEIAGVRSQPARRNREAYVNYVRRPAGAGPVPCVRRRECGDHLIGFNSREESAGAMLDWCSSVGVLCALGFGASNCAHVHEFE